MNDFTIAKIMLRKLRPKMFDNNWIRAFSLLKEIDRKSDKYIEIKKKEFVFLVDKLYKE